MNDRPIYQQLDQRRKKAVAAAVPHVQPIYVARAENATLWDVEGNAYIDFTGGNGSHNVGHQHPTVINAIKKQLDAFTHTVFAVSPYQQYVRLCERMNTLACGDFEKKTALFTTGAEAVENAIKVAKIATQRQGVIAFTGAYHGRSFATLALTGKALPYSKDLGLIRNNVFRARFPHTDTTIADALASIEQIFVCDSAPADIAAIIIEPVLGEGGFFAAPKEFMLYLRQVCDQHGIVLIADEVQCGVGRTGTFFAMEQMGTYPDITVFAKSIAAGLPLAGITAKAELIDAIAHGGFGGTYSGNPLSCAAANAVIDVIASEKLLEQAQYIGTRFKDAMSTLQLSHPEIETVHGIGAMVAFACKEQSQAAALIKHCQRNGLLLLSAGAKGNIIRVLVPLTIPAQQFHAGMQIIAAGCAKIFAK